MSYINSVLANSFKLCVVPWTLYSLDFSELKPLLAELPSIFIPISLQINQSFEHSFYAFKWDEINIQIPLGDYNIQINPITIPNNVNLKFNILQPLMVYLTLNETHEKNPSLTNTIPASKGNCRNPKIFTSAEIPGIPTKKQLRRTLIEGLCVRTFAVISECYESPLWRGFPPFLFSYAAVIRALKRHLNAETGPQQ